MNEFEKSWTGNEMPRELPITNIDNGMAATQKAKKRQAEIDMNQ